MPRSVKFLSLISFIFCISLSSQTKNSGPIITGFGEVWEINAPDFELDKTKELKAVFDIMSSPEDHNQINATIETAARFLNMHAQSGVPADQLKIALVVHNTASKDIITNEAYKKRYGTNNPNYELVQALLNTEGQIIFCGQSSISRGFPREDLIDGVQLSLSAMTALIQLQDEDYRLIKF